MCTTDQVQAHVCAQDHMSWRHCARDLAQEHCGRPTPFSKQPVRGHSLYKPVCAVSRLLMASLTAVDCST